MNTIILSCTQEDIYQYLYSDEGSDGSRLACPRSLCNLYTPGCWFMSRKRKDGLYYHLEKDSRTDKTYPELCSCSKTILWNELKTLGYVERFHIDAIKSEYYSAEYTTIIFSRDDMND